MSLTKRDWLYVIGVLLLAYGIRIVGLDHGLPFASLFTADAEHYVADAIAIAHSGDWNPKWFGHPGSTIIYSLAILFKVAHSISLGAVEPNHSLATLFEADPTAYYVIGRVFTISLGVLTVGVTYAIGKLAANRFVGLTAATLMAFSPLHVFISQLARTDSPVIFFANFSILAAMMIVSRPRWQRYILAGVAAGLATSTKYYGIVSAVGLPIAHTLMLVSRQMLPENPLSVRKWYKLIVGLALVPLTFALTSPFALIEWRTTWSNLAFERRETHLGADGLSPVGNLWWYISDTLPSAIGLLAAALILVGLWMARRKAKPVILVPLAFSGLFLIAISLQHLHWDRWLAPALPTMALLAGLGLYGVVNQIKVRFSVKSIRLVAYALLFAVFFALPLYRTIRANADRVLPDTRIVTGQWINQNLPAGSKLAMENYTAPLDGAVYDTSISMTVSNSGIEAYCQQGFDYVVISSYIYERFDLDPERYRSNVAFYDALTNEEILVYEAAPKPWRLAGPRVKVYQLSGCDRE